MTDLTRPEGLGPGALVIERREEAGRQLVVLRGELDLTSAPELERELREVESSRPDRLVIDLAGLEFMDSTGLRTLLEARDRSLSQGYALALRRGQRQVQRVLELTRTDEVFEFED